MPWSNGENRERLLKVFYSGISSVSNGRSEGGLVERSNRTLADMLSMYVGNAHTDWDTILPYITFSYIFSHQESTRRMLLFFLRKGGNTTNRCHDEREDKSGEAWRARRSYEETKEGSARDISMVT